MAKPSRGEVWLVDLDPTTGREQAGQRPALVISVDVLNRSAAEIAIVAPMTSRQKRVRSHVAVPAGEAGLRTAGFVKCEDVRSISTRRLLHRFGVVSRGIVEEVEERLRFLMGL